MFSPVSFSPLSFSLSSFNGATKDSARSGYWRLFYYQLQEEEIKARSKSDPPPSGVIKKRAPRVKAPRHVESKIQRAPLSPPQKIRRILESPQREVASTPIFILIHRLMSEIQGLYAPIRGRMETPVLVQSDRKLRLLLLLGG